MQWLRKATASKKRRASGVLFVRDHSEHGQQMLLGKRNGGMTDQGTWATIGGFVPKGQKNLFTSALREVKEELGSYPKFKILGRHQYEKPKTSLSYTTFILECQAKNWKPRKLNHEHSETRWVSLEEARKLPLQPGLKSMLDLMGDKVFNKL